MKYLVWFTHCDVVTSLFSTIPELKLPSYLVVQLATFVAVKLMMWSTTTIYLYTKWL